MGPSLSAMRERGSLDRVEGLGRGPGLAELHLFYRGDQLFMGRGPDASLAPLFDDEAVDEIDLGAAALLHVLAHRWALVLAPLLRVAQGKHQALDLVERGAVAFRGA